MLLEARGLTKEFTAPGRKLKAVNAVDFGIEEGAFIGITGRSGSGKTTLAAMLAGLMRPTNGSVCFNGRSIYELKDDELAFLCNRKIGFIPQGDTLLYNLSVLDNILLPWYLSSREREAETKAKKLLNEMEILPLAHCLPSSLSGGELRRAAIARALINQPEIIIADEPTASLDQETAIEIMELLYRVSEDGTAVAVITHEPELLHSLTKIYSMNQGSLAPGQ